MCGLGPRLAQVQLSHRACPSSSSSLIHSNVTIRCLWNIAMAVSQTSLTLHHGVNQAEGYKKGELLFIYRHYRNQQRWEHIWKCSLGVLYITFGYSPVGTESSRRVPLLLTRLPPQPFFKEFVKKGKTTDSNKHKSYQMRMSPGSSSDGGRLWEQEGRVLLDSWSSSLMVSGSERFVSIWSAHWLWQKDFPLFSHQHW